LKLWKKGAFVGTVLWLSVIGILWIFGSNAAYIVVFLLPDFVVVGAVLGYLMGRIYSKAD
jgi:hypothetical protein